MQLIIFQFELQWSSTRKMSVESVNEPIRAQKVDRTAILKSPSEALLFSRRQTHSHRPKVKFELRGCLQRIWALPPCFITSRGVAAHTTPIAPKRSQCKVCQIRASPLSIPTPCIRHYPFQPLQLLLTLCLFFVVMALLPIPRPECKIGRNLIAILFPGLH